MERTPSMPPRENKASVKIYFTDFFGAHPAILEQYGALNVLLVSDLPLFVDPFLLFKAPSTSIEHYMTASLITCVS
jgi:hypothetical protein